MQDNRTALRGLFFVMKYISPNHRESLSATSSLNGQNEYVTSTNHALDVNATVSGSVTIPGVSTATNQTNGSQLTQIVDAGGEAVTVTGGKLDVNATVSGGSGTSSIDKSAFTVGSDSGTPAMGVYQSSLDTLSNGTTALFGMTNKRAIFANLQTSGGTETGVAATPLQVSLANTGANATAVKVDGSAVTQPVSGTVSIQANASVNLSQVAGQTAISSGVNGSQAVGGDTASAAADAGNPVKIGGKVNTTLPTFTDGQRGDLQLGIRGAALVQIMGAGSTTGAAASASGADGKSNSTAGINVYTLPSVFNSSTWDRTVSVVNATNSTGTGIAAAGILAQFDDVSPTSITENQFGNIRMSANRNVYGTIRDAAGNERGVNVTSGNSLQADLTTIAGTGAVTGHGTATGALRVELPTDGTGLVNAAQNGTWTVQPGNTANTTAWLVKQDVSSSATESSVNDTATSTTILASNSARKMALVENTSTADLYIRFSSSAATTSIGGYSVIIPANGGYYELPVPIYTGQINGIWLTDPNTGGASITEY